MISFSKMTGAGNDFVAVDNREIVIQDPARFAKIVCDRRYGIGGDGVLLVERNAKADFTMKYYNADGSYGGMCGNGGRCIAQFAKLIGVVAGNKFKFEALGHVYSGEIDHDIVSLRMKDPSSLLLGDRIDVDGLSINVHFVNTGSPHCVILDQENPGLLKPDFSMADIFHLGRKIRYHQRFAPDGTNVNFVQILDATSIRIRTYERGVEDETLACGTGSIASAVVTAMLGKCESPVEVHTRSNEILTISFFEGEKDVSEVTLTGRAQMVFQGSIDFK